MLLGVLHSRNKHDSAENAPSLTPQLYFFLLTTEDGEDTISELPLPNVKSQVLQKVIEFCEHHLSEPMTEIEKPLKSQVMADVVQKWYADFVDLEQVLLFELILAANYMDIKPLLDLTCATVASMIKGKTVRSHESSQHLVAGCKRVSMFLQWCHSKFHLILTYALLFEITAGRHPYHLQHYQRFLAGGRGPSSRGEQVVRGGVNNLHYVLEKQKEQLAVSCWHARRLTERTETVYSLLLSKYREKKLHYFIPLSFSKMRINCKSINVMRSISYYA